MSALVITHTESEDAGRLGEWLPEAGLALEVLEPWRGDVLPERVVDHDALVVMGGPQQAYDDTSAPWLRQTKDLLRRAVADGVPVLGICLGAQLLAEATGGRVAPGTDGPEVGAKLVAKRDTSASDALLASVPFTPPVVQWHWDAVVDLPPGAVLLASSTRYPHQAFRVGDSAWGFQFHVEPPAEMVARWAELNAEDLRAEGLDPAEVLTAAVAELPEIGEVWQPVVARFAALALAPPGLSVLSLQALPLDDPRAAELAEAMAEEMRVRYGVEGAGPIHTEDFAVPPAVFLVASREGRPVGCGGLRLLEPGVGEVKRMYVDPSARGRGVARALLTALTRHGREAGLTRLQLETGTRQPEAIGLYESEGWLPIPPYGHFKDQPLTRCYALDL